MLQASPNTHMQLLLSHHRRHPAQNQLVAGPDPCDTLTGLTPGGRHCLGPRMPPAPADAAAKSGLLAPLILIGNGNPSSALHSLGDRRLPQLLLQAPPAAGLQEGGWEERERELLLGAGRQHCPCTGAQSHHKTKSQTSRADLREGPRLVPAGQGGAGGQLGGWEVTEVGSTHLPCDQ